MSAKLLIVKVRKNEEGDITDVMLNNREVHPIEEALSMSKQGLIEDIIVKDGPDGTMYYRNNPNGHGDDSFCHLPNF